MPKFTSRSSFKGNLKKTFKNSPKSFIKCSSLDSESKVYRNSTITWLEDFLTKEEIIPHPKQFVSFSFSKKKTRQFGDIQIIFDYEKLKKQGAKSIDYNAIEMFYTDPKVIEYVTGFGFEDEEDYYNEFDLESAEEAHARHELSWEDYIDLFREEEEIIMKKLIYEPGIIKKVILPRKHLLRIKPLLKKHHIPYEII